MIAILLALAVTAGVAPAIITWLGRRGFYVLALAPAVATVVVLMRWPTDDDPWTERISWVPALRMDIDLRMDTLGAVNPAALPLPTEWSGPVPDAVSA